MQRRIDRSTLALVAFAGSAMLAASSAVADPYEWTGEGGTNNWSENENWVNGAPGSNVLTSMIFADDGGDNTANANQAPYTGISGLTFEAGEYEFQLTGGELSLNLDTGDSSTAKITAKNAGSITINNDLKANDGKINFQGPGELTIQGEIDVDQNQGDFRIDNDAQGNESVLTLKNRIVNTSGAINKNGDGTLVIDHAQDYAGGLLLKEGVVVAGDDEALGTGVLIPDGGAIASDSDDRTVANQTRLANTLKLVGDHDLTMTGELDMDAHSRKIEVSADNNLTILGVVKNETMDPRELTKLGEGTLTLHKNTAYQGNTIIEAGRLNVLSGLSGGLVINGGELGLSELGGGGEAGRRLSSPIMIGGDLTVNHGTINLSGDGTWGGPFVNGDLNFNEGAVLRMDTDSAQITAEEVVNVVGKATLASGSRIVIRELSEDKLDANGRSVSIIFSSEDILDEGVKIEAAAASNINVSGGVDPHNSKRFAAEVTPGSGGGGKFAELTKDTANPSMGTAIDTLSPDAAELDFATKLTQDELDAAVAQQDQGGRASAAAYEISVTENRAYTNAQAGYLAGQRGGPAGQAMAQQDSKGSAFRARPLLASTAVDPQLLSAALVAADPSASRSGIGSFADGGAEPRRYGGYAKGYGLFADVASGDDRTGYQADTYGAQAGLDYRVSDELLVGLAFGYAYTDADMAGGLGQIDANAVRVGPYASFSRDQWYVDASATYAFHQTDTERMGLGADVNGDFDAHDVSLFAGTGYDFELDNGLVLTPTGSLQYTYYTRESYEEQGVGALSYDDSDTHTLHSRLGGQVSYAFAFDGFALVPELALGWEHEYLQDDDAVRAQFAAGSNTFDINTSAPEQDSAYVALGLSALLKENVSTFVKYEGNFGEDTEVHGVSAGLAYRF